MLNTLNKFAKKNAPFSIRKLKYIIAICISLTTTGCFKVEGIHYVNHNGSADSGGYSISMFSTFYSSLIADDPGTFDDLYTFSNPSISTRDGETFISDTSGSAKMENFYDSFNCVPAPTDPNWSDCTFQFDSDDLTFPNWSVNWQVVLHDEMVIINSNHHKYTNTKGNPTLSWYFDGNKTSSFDVSFTVRVPNEDS
ncbi:MAG: hypothetical protein AAGK97_08985 [Bacteroidota bacterium]